MKIRTLLICSLVACLIPVNSTTAEDQLTLTLSDGLRMALSQNPDLKVESLYREMTEADVAKAHAIYDPTLFLSVFSGWVSWAQDDLGTNKTLSFNTGINQLLPTGGNISVSLFTSPEFQQFCFRDQNGECQEIVRDTNWRTSANVSLSQPLLKNAGMQVTELAITIAENAREDAVQRYKGFATDTVLSFVTNYNRLYTLKQSLKTKEQSLEAAVNLLSETSSRQQAGTASNLDVANAEYGVAFRRKEMVDAQRAVRDQEATLSYMLGLSGRTIIDPVEPPNIQEPEESEDQAVKMALENRSDIKQMRLALKINELQERIARNQTLPDLSLSASATSHGFGGGFDDNLSEMGYGSGFWEVGGQLTFPLGNTAAKNEYRRAKLRTEQLKNQLQALELRIENEIRADLRAIISARLQLGVARKAREAAEQRLLEYRNNLVQGTSTTQEVLEAEADLSTARNAETEAGEGFSSGVIKLWRDMGVLLDRKGIHFASPDKERPVTEPEPPRGQNRAPVNSTTIESKEVPAPAIAPVSFRGTNTPNAFPVRLVSSGGIPLAAGTTVHDLNGREWGVGANGVVAFDFSEQFLPIVGKAPDGPCWTVVSSPAGERKPSGTLIEVECRSAP